MGDPIVINGTHGRDDPERATLAFVVGNVAASADQDAIVLLTIDGVWNATEGYADDVHEAGFEPLATVVRSFVANGGEIWVCGACAEPRGITDDDLVEGARIVSAVQAVEVLAGGASALSF